MRHITTLYTSLFIILLLNISIQSSQACRTINLDIRFDNYPGQVSWEIIDADNNVFANSANYNNSILANANATENICIPDGCYTLNFKDAMGNGMCQGSNTTTTTTTSTINASGPIVATLGSSTSPSLCGSYKLIDTNGATLAAGGGNFGAVQSTQFCIGTPIICNELNLDIEFGNSPTQNSWEIIDANNNIVASSTGYNDLTANINATENLCLPDGCYTLSFKDAMGIGMCQSSTTTNTIYSSNASALGTLYPTNTPIPTLGTIYSSNTSGLGTLYATNTSGPSIGTIYSSNASGLGTLYATNTPIPTLGTIYSSNTSGLGTLYATNTSGSTTGTTYPANIPGQIVGTIGISTSPSLCGRYSLTDANGTILVTGGGNFGAVQNTEFCISSSIDSRLENNDTQILVKDKINVYPTMASDFVNVEFDFDSETNINLVIYDINGKMVDQYINQTVYANENIQLDIANLNRGNYFIKMDSFGAIVTKRFIKF